MTRMRNLGFALTALLLAALVFPPLSSGGGKDEKDKKDDDKKYNLIYVPTEEKVIEKMFAMANVKKGDVVFDLGCGDGRIIAMAAKKFGTRGVGIDLNPERIRECMDTIKKYNVEALVDKGLVEYRLGDALKVPDLGDASVLMLYMLPEFMNLLEPIARKTLKPGTRIVSHDYKWNAEDWTPDETVEFKGPVRTHTIYMWTVKAKK